MTATRSTGVGSRETFDWPLDPGPRLRRALRLLRRIVPYDRCGLLDTPAVGGPRLVVEPDTAAARERGSRLLWRCATLLTDEGDRTVEGRLHRIALVLAPGSHLPVPVVGLDRVMGVLSLEGTGLYRDDDLRLVSVVAAQIAAYLPACRLREQEAQIAPSTRRPGPPPRRTAAPKIRS